MIVLLVTKFYKKICEGDFWDFTVPVWPVTVLLQFFCDLSVRVRPFVF
jgi:hypothetical protein